MHLLRDARLAVDGAGAVWIAEEHGYRLRHFSPVGKLLSELTVGKGKPAVRERSAAEIEQQLARAQQGAGQRLNPASLRFTAPRTLDGLAAARDGRVYIVVEPAGDGDRAPLALDRFDPVRLTLERVLVDGIAERGRVSVALGRDALYIAPFSAEAGLWRLPWDQLEAAKWERVGDGKLNGEPLPPD
jgi:sugar lactone lactonase YvrE